MSTKAYHVGASPFAPDTECLAENASDAAEVFMTLTRTNSCYVREARMVFRRIARPDGTYLSGVAISYR